MLYLFLVAVVTYTKQTKSLKSRLIETSVTLRQICSLNLSRSTVLQNIPTYTIYFMI